MTLLLRIRQMEVSICRTVVPLSLHSKCLCYTLAPLQMSRLFSLLHLWLYFINCRLFWSWIKQMYESFLHWEPATTDKNEKYTCLFFVVFRLLRRGTSLLTIMSSSLQDNCLALFMAKLDRCCGHTKIINTRYANMPKLTDQNNLDETLTEALDGWIWILSQTKPTLNFI